MLWKSLLVVASVATPALAQELSFGGQVRPRFEYRRSVGNDRAAFTSMRVRGQLAARLKSNVQVLFQVQDVRLWVRETDILGTHNFGLHQGYVEIASPGSSAFSARVGRQEISFGGQRLVGAVNWSQQGRAFDAVRLGVGTKVAQLDIFGALPADAITAANDDNAYFVGAYGQAHGAGPGTLEFYGFFNRVDGGSLTKQYTIGTRWWGTTGPVSFRGEGSYQFGDRSGADVTAYMIGARVGVAIPGASSTVTLWYDYLSGDDDLADAEIRVFETLFATNHKYYGFADYFTNIPVHTAGRGLQDAAIKATYAPNPKITVGLDVHSFHLANSNGLSTGHLGEEFDLTLAYSYSGNVRFIGGLSRMFVADGFAEIGRLTDDANWVYLMTDVRF